MQICYLQGLEQEGLAKGLLKLPGSEETAGAGFEGLAGDLGGFGPPTPALAPA